MVDNKQFHRFDPKNALIEETVNTLFNKVFSFKNSEPYLLPKPEFIFSENSWHIEELYQIKTELNNTKSKLNDYCLIQWNEHTRKRNKAGSVQWFINQKIEPEFVTQAWCKFYEIVSSFPLIPQIAISEGSFTSVHLCEAPGAFVTSLNHWLKAQIPTINWDWIATSLNPYYEGNTTDRMITDDRFIMHTLNHWNFGPYNTGNIMDLENLEFIIEDCKTKHKVFLVTADGSVDCSGDPGEQERMVAQLHFCEVVTALHILSEGGSFLLKMFTVFEQTSVCLLYLLASCFDSIHMFKPATSKEGNSEVYVICLGFKGTIFLERHLPILRANFKSFFLKAMFRRQDIPNSFVNQVQACAEFFKNHQCKVILDNIKTFSNDKGIKDFNLMRIKRVVAERFIEAYNLKKLESEDLGIVGRTKLSACNNITAITKCPLESFSERQMKSSLDPKCRLYILLEELQIIEAFEEDSCFQQFFNTPVKLWITMGKPYRRIQSSKFSTIKVLRIQNRIFEIIDTMNLSINFPTKENLVQYLKGKNYIEMPNIRVLQFQHTSEQKNYEMIHKVHETLKNCLKGDDIILIGYSLLSQLNVGLLNLLARSFVSLILQPDSKVGYVIILKYYISDSEKESFEKLLEVAETAKSKNMMVLSVFSMLDLCETDWIKKLININMWNIKMCAKSIAETIDKNDHQEGNF